MSVEVQVNFNNVNYHCFCEESVICMPCFRVSLGKSPQPLIKPKPIRKHTVKHPSLIYNSHIMKPNLTFGNLTTIRKYGGNRNGRIRWLCFCRCGDKIIVTRMDLLNNLVTMCKDCTRLTNECRSTS